jgi:hypothetical protein
VAQTAPNLPDVAEIRTRIFSCPSWAVSEVEGLSDMWGHCITVKVGPKAASKAKSTCNNEQEIVQNWHAFVSGAIRNKKVDRTKGKAQKPEDTPRQSIK